MVNETPDSPFTDNYSKKITAHGHYQNSVSQAKKEHFTFHGE